MSIENYAYILSKFDEVHDAVWNKANLHKKVSLHANENPLFSETIYETGFKIDERYNVILEILLENPDLNISEIYGEIRNKNKKFIRASEKSFDDGEYQKIRRMIKDLIDIKYIHKVTEKGKPIGKFKKISDIPFRLSLGGIFYILINNSDFLYGDLRQFLKKYPDNILFQYFLYPYFEKTTLQELPYIHTAIIQYLEEVSKLISNQLAWKNPEGNPSDGYRNYSLFMWEREDSKLNNAIYQDRKWDELKRYLDNELGWNWVYNASFIPEYVNNTLSIISNAISPTPTIFINSTKKDAVLKHKGNSYYIFNVLQAGNILDICGKLVPKSEHLNESFRNGLMLKLVMLLLNINTYNNSIVLDRFYKLNPNLLNNAQENKKILSQDKKFITITEKIIGMLQENIMKKG